MGNENFIEIENSSDAERQWPVGTQTLESRCRSMSLLNYWRGRTALSTWTVCNDITPSYQSLPSVLNTTHEYEYQTVRDRVQLALTSKM